jgi:hypothetical protein
MHRSLRARAAYASDVENTMLGCGCAVWICQRATGSGPAIGLANLGSQHVETGQTAVTGVWRRGTCADLQRMDGHAGDGASLSAPAGASLHSAGVQRSLEDAVLLTASTPLIFTSLPVAGLRT